MGRRPLCLVCLFLMCGLYLADWMGIPLVRGNPLSESEQEWILEHSETEIFGKVTQCQDTEYSQSVYLKNVYLINRSKQIPIENVRVFLKEKEKVPVGAVILVSGKLTEIEKTRNPGEFDSKQFYASQHIFYFLEDAVITKIAADNVGYGQILAEIREKLAEILQVVSGKDAAVFEAMVLGQKGSLESELKLRYQMAGIIHILSISGTHISYLGMAFFAALKFIGLSNVPAGFVSLFVMLQYGLLTGGSVSAMRAVAMFALTIGAKILGRSCDVLTVLAFSAIILLLDSPAYLYNSGFLMSFGAVMGLSVTAPILHEAFKRKGKITQMFLSSAAVQLTTLPIVLWAYGEVSVIGLVLNLLVLPTVGMVLTSGIAGCLVGFICVPAAKYMVFPGRVLLFLYEKICNITNGFSFGIWVGGSPKSWQIVVYYVALVIGLFMVSVGKRRVKIWFFVVLLALGVAVLGKHPAAELTITCLDVGQGDGAVLKTPGNRYFLIDCGSSNKSNVGQYQLLPYLKSQGISYLDGIFVSHTDEDHISGIVEFLELKCENLTAVDVGYLILPKWREQSENYKKLVTLADMAGVKAVSMNAGMALQSGDVCIKILAPEVSASGENVNEDAMVILVEYGDFQGLFTGDIGAETEKKLLGSFYDVDFLKVAHHGSRYSTCDVFLDQTKPEVAVISCSSSNTYGHPSSEVIERLEKLECQVEYTMKHGAIIVRTNGETMQVKRWLKED